MASTTSDGARSGGCLCGRIRFEAAGQPLWVAYCHCRSCRHQTASPVTLFAGFPPGKVRFTVSPAVHASSPGVERGFCGDCGTPLYYACPERWPDEIHLYTATFDAPETFQPGGHGSWHEHLPGFDVRDDLPRR